LSRIENGRKWLRRSKFCTKRSRAVIIIIIIIIIIMFSMHHIVQHSTTPPLYFMIFSKILVLSLRSKHELLTPMEISEP
jgi:hypothetical protein